MGKKEKTPQQREAYNVYMRKYMRKKQRQKKEKQQVTIESVPMHIFSKSEDAYAWANTIPIVPKKKKFRTFSQKIADGIAKTKAEKDAKEAEMIEESKLYGICVHCGNRFKHKNKAGKKSKTCSIECKKAYKAAFIKDYLLTYKKKPKQAYSNGYKTIGRTLKANPDKLMFSNSLTKWVFSLMSKTPRTDKVVKFREAAEKFAKALNEECKRAKTIKLSYKCLVCGETNEQGKDCKCGIKWNAQKKARKNLGMK